VRTAPFRLPLARQQTFAHPNCYARCLGNCSTDISSEHFFTFDLLRKVTSDPRGLFLRGAPWQPDGVWLQPESAGVRVLCTHHNGLLSPLDAFASSLDDELARISTAATERRRVSTIAQFYGPNLERWLMKALCGFAMARAGALASSYTAPLVPDAWVRYLFCENELDPPAGLYLTSTPGQEVNIDPNGFTFTTLGARGTLCGLMVDMRNTRLIFIATSFQGQIGGVLTSDSVRRPWRMSFRCDAALSLVEFDWPGEAGPEVRYQIVAGAA
jgi:hypothetical protein